MVGEDNIISAKKLMEIEKDLRNKLAYDVGQITPTHSYRSYKLFLEGFNEAKIKAIRIIEGNPLEIKEYPPEKINR